MPRRSRKKTAKRVINRKKNDLPEVALADEGCLFRSKAQDLPVEILSDIFAYLVPTTYAPIIKAATLAQWRALFSSVFPLKFAVVCRAWRHAALSSPALWTSFFITIHSPSTRALKAMRVFMRTMTDRSSQSQKGLHVGIRFSGAFQFASACDAVRPLLEHQRRWEKIEIKFDVKEQIAKDMVLNVGELELLKELQLDGSIWDARASDGVANPGELRVLSVRNFKLFNFRQSTRTSLIAGAQNLEELEISVNVMEHPHGPPIRFERLRKLNVVDVTYGSYVLCAFQCPVLEELFLNGFTDTTFGQLDSFIHNSAASLQVLDLAIKHDYTPSPTDFQHLRDTLNTQTQLRTFSLARGRQEIDQDILFILTALDDIGVPRYCPKLEQIYLSGVVSYKDMYEDLARLRWTALSKSIRRMRFHNCRIVDRRGPPHERLYLFYEIYQYKAEGLEIEVTNNYD